jgi:hypothetical protein
MPFFKCPVCSAKGIYCIGEDDFHEWLAAYFGPCYIADEEDLLSMPCHQHFLDSGCPETDAEFKEWFDANKRNNRASAPKRRIATKKKSDLGKKSTVPVAQSQLTRGQKAAATRKRNKLKKKRSQAAYKAWETRRRKSQGK